MMTPQPEPPTTRRTRIRDHVRRRVESLQRSYRSDESRGRAGLAALRGAVSAPIGAHPDAYQAVFESVDPTLLGRGDSPSSAERAMHLAMTLYGVHQQSRQDADMHVRDVSLGRAVGRLARPDDAESREKPVMRRFNALVTATEYGEFAHHLRGLVQQLRAERIPLDYGQLAVDLDDLQRPERRNDVRLRWSRDSLAAPRADGASSEQAPDSNAAQPDAE